jgi:hypothetical protein
MLSETVGYDNPEPFGFRHIFSVEKGRPITAFKSAGYFLDGCHRWSQYSGEHLMKSTRWPVEPIAV